MTKQTSRKNNPAHTPLLISIPGMKGIELFLLKHVLCFEGNGKDTNIYILHHDTANGTRVIKRTATRCLKYYQDNLPETFMRVHKSFIVNVLYLKDIARNNEIEFSEKLPIEVKVNAIAKKQLMAIML